MFTALNPLLTKNTSNMRIFLDTADIDEIRKADETGLIDGVTTNPTLIRKAGKDPIDVYRDIANTGLGDISMEVTGTYEQMLNQAAVLCETFGDQATIKLPMTEDGLKACKVLSPRVKTNITLVFNTAQAVLAAKAGAHYVSPFVGRIDEGLCWIRSCTWDCQLVLLSRCWHSGTSCLNPHSSSSCAFLL